eukprot:COSAG02_NODE_3090_length_7388_cov_7.725614_6_plen_110_part_00
MCVLCRKSDGKLRTSAGEPISSRNTRIEDSSIRTETEPLTERLDCVDRAPIRWGWRRGLREQREAGGACGTLFFSGSEEEWTGEARMALASCTAMLYVCAWKGACKRLE